jgi:hypothetical protein
LRRLYRARRGASPAAAEPRIAIIFVAELKTVRGQVDRTNQLLMSGNRETIRHPRDEIADRP